MTTFTPIAHRKSMIIELTDVEASFLKHTVETFLTVVQKQENEAAEAQNFFAAMQFASAKRIMTAIQMKLTPMKPGEKPQ